jgi:hypothetical protein
MAKSEDNGTIISNKVPKLGFVLILHSNSAKNSIGLTLNSNDTMSYSITIFDIVGKKCC